ncbi:MAG: hypothetical protein CVU88_07720, partial [Firmicutes bacterium HGW-Firmicutes-13]
MNKFYQNQHGESVKRDNEEQGVYNVNEKLMCLYKTLTLREWEFIKNINSMSWENWLEKNLKVALESYDHILQQWIGSIRNVGMFTLYFWPLGYNSDCPVIPLDQEQDRIEADTNASHYSINYNECHDKPFLARLVNVKEFSKSISKEIFICTPVKIDKKTVGITGVFLPEKVSPDLYLFMSSLFATAISNYFEAAVLSLFVEENLQKIEHLRKKAIQTQEDERKLIAFEIHDVISQRAAAIFYRLQTIEHFFKKRNIEDIEKEISEVSKITQVMVDDITRLMFNLKPPHLDELGVETSLRRYIDQYKKEYGILVDLKVKGLLNTVDPAIKLTTYRIVQEGLTNIQKHSQVKRASVILRMAD